MLSRQPSNDAACTFFVPGSENEHKTGGEANDKKHEAQQASWSERERVDESPISSRLVGLLERSGAGYKSRSSGS